MTRTYTLSRFQSLRDMVDHIASKRAIKRDGRIVRACRPQPKSGRKGR